MRKINKPNIKQDDICNSFNSLKYKDRIIEKSNNYEIIINDIKKNLDDEKAFQTKHNDYTEYMKKMYSERFSKRQYENLYKFYQEIRGGEKYCPYCNMPSRMVRQIDHYLPKAKFPSLSIVAKNLVPICKDCNEIKGEYYSLNMENQLIHPYYDTEMVDSFEYIECTIIESDNIGFKFNIKKLDHWSDVFYKRIIFHFEKLEINKIYLSDFIAEFDVYIEELKKSYIDLGGRDIIKKLIKFRSESYYEKKIMPWRYAGLKALLESEWFFNNFFL